MSAAVKQLACPVDPSALVGLLISGLGAVFVRGYMSRHDLLAESARHKVSLSWVQGVQPHPGNAAEKLASADILVAIMAFVRAVASRRLAHYPFSPVETRPIACADGPVSRFKRHYSGICSTGGADQLHWPQLQELKQHCVDRDYQVLARVSAGGSAGHGAGSHWPELAIGLPSDGPWPKR